MKEKHPARKIAFFAVVALVAVSAYILGIIPAKSYKCFVFPNAGVSVAAVDIVPEFNGFPVKCDKMIITNASAPVKKDQSVKISGFKSGFVSFMRAKRINIFPESTFESGCHTYLASYEARNFIVTAIDTKDSLIGTAAFSILPDKPVVVKTVKVCMRKTKFSKGNYGILNVFGISGAEIEESKTAYGFVNLAEIRSAKNESSRIYVPLGATFYVCAESRPGASRRIPAKWERSGFCAVQALNFSSATGYVKNGECGNLRGYVEYSYVREKIIIRKPFGTYVAYSETVVPVSLEGCVSGEGSCEPPPSVSGKTVLIGDGDGNYTSVELKGKPGIYLYTPKPLVINADFDGGNNAETLNIPVCAEKHYAQHVSLEITGISPETDGTIKCFDGNTNWGDAYFIFQKYKN